mmetsp:Transcript_19549/g.22747  ORF Transcript_19549/g.22747 Transcript_19549/m.22747 type:complete len:98 (+) Transcript_19549:13-306(+)
MSEDDRSGEALQQFLRDRKIDIAQLEAREGDKLRADRTDKFADELKEIRGLPYTSNELKRASLETATNALDSIFDTCLGLCSERDAGAALMSVAESF